MARLYFNKARRHPFWNDVAETDWNDWHWQMQNRVSTPEQLQVILGLTDVQTAEVRASLTALRMTITPYYLSQIDLDDPLDPILLQSVPTSAELAVAAGEQEDPLAEEHDCPVPGLEGVLTHRYPDRAILYITYQCSMYCRHCTRRRRAGETDEPTSFELLERAAEYIRNTPQVRDVLITGGDPLTLSTARLERILQMFRPIEHVEIIRLGTRVPVVLPMRITDELTAMLKKYQPLWINTHFNHPNEMTDVASAGIGRLADAGFPLGNQTVLLRRINNHPLLMKKLMQLLVQNRIRPYYIFQCDPSQGLDHFRCRIEEGIEIIEHLKGHTTGFAVPTFTVDGIDGAGKIPVGPNYVVSQSTKRWVLRNYEGVIFNSDQPADYLYEAPSHVERFALRDGRLSVAEILSGDRVSNLTPAGNARLARRKKAIQARS